MPVIGGSRGAASTPCRSPASVRNHAGASRHGEGGLVVVGICLPHWLRNMTVPFLKLVPVEVVEPHWEGRRPSSGAMIAAALCKSVLGSECGEAANTAAMHARHSPTQLPQELLRDTDVVLPEFAEVVANQDGDEDDDVRAQIEQVKAARSRHMLRLWHMSTLVAAAVEALTAARPSPGPSLHATTSAADDERKSRRFVRMPLDSPPQVGAQALLPALYRISKE